MRLQHRVSEDKAVRPWVQGLQPVWAGGPPGQIVGQDDLPRWTTGPDWLETLDPWPDGLVFTDAVLETHGVARSWRIWLGGAELELTVVDMNWADIAPVDPGTRRVVSAGLRILIDKDGLLDALTRALAED